MSSDLINAFFEFGGSIAMLMSIFKITQDKKVAGISWFMVAFFMSWGMWNIYFYYDINQMFSWYAGMLLSFMNSIYLYLLLKYK